MVFRPQGLLSFRGRRQALPEELPEPAAEPLPAPPAARQQAPSGG
jgi:hypothetical protein